MNIGDILSSGPLSRRRSNVAWAIVSTVQEEMSEWGAIMMNRPGGPHCGADSFGTLFVSMKLSISLNKPKPTLQKQPVLHAPAFGVVEDDDELDDRNNSKGPVAHAAQSSKAMQKRIAAEKQVDATVYEYDEVWDKMQEAKQRQQLAREADTAARKVCTIADAIHIHC